MRFAFSLGCTGGGPCALISAQCWSTCRGSWGMPTRFTSSGRPVGWSRSAGSPASSTGRAPPG
eukprot:10361401-Alexandrium_andersonii.AAC.1